MSASWLGTAVTDDLVSRPLSGGEQTRVTPSSHRMTAEGVRFSWRWDGDRVLLKLDSVWKFSAHRVHLMKSNAITTTANPDLVVAEGGRTRWNTPERRRWGFHNLHRISRYGLSLRSRDVLVLRRDIDRRIAEFKFIHWRGGSEAIRQNGLFKDFYSLAEHETEKRKELYVLDCKYPLRFLRGGRALSSGVMHKSEALS